MQEKKKDGQVTIIPRLNLEYLSLGPSPHWHLVLIFLQSMHLLCGLAYTDLAIKYIKSTSDGEVSSPPSILVVHILELRLPFSGDEVRLKKLEQVNCDIQVE